MESADAVDPPVQPSCSSFYAVHYWDEDKSFWTVRRFAKKSFADSDFHKRLQSVPPGRRFRLRLMDSSGRILRWRVV